LGRATSYFEHRIIFSANSLELYVNVLETKRLILRWFTIHDASFVFELLNQPSWKRFIGDRGIDTIEAARHYIETVPLAAYRRHGFGLFAVELKLDHTLAGMCGLIKRDALNDFDIGFAFLPDFEGQGLAYEAASALLSYSANTIGIKKVLAIASVDNERSVRLLERLGMHYDGLVRLSDDDEQLKLYSITLQRTEYKKCT
jgi:[ribosomal protein S5]-alanine N-acetyltransferase